MHIISCIFTDSAKDTMKRELEKLLRKLEEKCHEIKDIETNGEYFK